MRPVSLLLLRHIVEQKPVVRQSCSMSQTGFELHTGDWASVCDACTTGEPSKLHSGDHSESHVIFPDPFGAGDILFIQDIVAEITSSSPIHIDFERWECGCLFVDRLAINWVRSVATLDVNWRRGCNFGDNVLDEQNVASTKWIGKDYVRFRMVARVKF